MNQRSAGRTIVLQGPLAGMLLGVVLGVGVFLGAVLVRRWIQPASPHTAPPVGFVMGGDPRGGVRILAGEWAPGAEAVLVPLRDDGASSAEQEQMLNATLFPGGEAVRWGRILVRVAEDAAAVDVDLGPGALRLGEEGVLIANADLAAAFEEHRAELRPHHRFALEVEGAHRSVHRVEPGAALRALLAFPGQLGPEEAEWAEMRDGRRLRAARVTTESLRTAQSTGDPSRVQPADTTTVTEGRPAGSR